MGKTAFLNARIDPELKVSAEKIFDGVGVTASQAITMFYRQVVFRRGIPFDVCIPNEATVAALEDAEAGKVSVSSDDTAKAMAEILAES